MIEGNFKRPYVPKALITSVVIVERPSQEEGISSTLGTFKFDSIYSNALFSNEVYYYVANIKTVNGTNDIDSLVVVCILRQRSILLEYNYPEIMITDTCIKLLSYFFCW